ncbi:hypothetical protein SADUNF_Sadunf10G0184800 [Salix dunnii]|uniref:Uncharacterized protein n=1 Tax=Salix dunnii TaxID=1413687 RepID=A0A835JPG4_9ROSI|nr:hypothetical protein SADUNF_Sadunf10G0184800 [Salix dunnii]
MQGADALTMFRAKKRIVGWALAHNKYLTWLLEYNQVLWKSMEKTKGATGLVIKHNANSRMLLVESHLFFFEKVEKSTTFQLGQ